MTAPNNSNHADLAPDHACASNEERVYRYEITGTAAHSRIAKLLPSSWVDCSPYVNHEENQSRMPASVDFLWSNAPRAATKSYRDIVSAYSHLPNGTAILDDKWVLARLLGGGGDHDKDEKEKNDDDAAEVGGLESHCFRGPDGFAKFCDRVGMFEANDAREFNEEQQQYAYPELIGDENANEANNMSQSPPPPPPEPTNLWVVKDAQSNGAGGIWVVDPTNASRFLPASSCGNNNTSSSTSPLIDKHRYVAQRYAWPPMLYHGRKFHVRVYGLITADGKAYVHERCFLHVANEQFEYGKEEKNGEKDNGAGDFEPSVHITNCCANSHDETKFSGEICADLGRALPADASDDYAGISSATAVPLGDYLPSISFTLATLAQRAMPYISGGMPNGGFEYLGMDFILSPGGVAHLLEVNAPPSQDTATGLPHAEELHDDVLRDLLTLWVLPKVDATRKSNAGGWRCVYEPEQNLAETESNQEERILPSKAAIVNKMRWSIFEWKMAKRYDEENRRLQSMLTNSPEQDDIRRIRNAFPYFNCGDKQDDASTMVFVENAGGTQVPSHVMEAMTMSLGSRHRAVQGSQSKEAARETLMSILGACRDSHCMFLGPNATSLFETLAQKYFRSKRICAGDEIIISTENHLANVTPWERLAADTGAVLVWWNPTEDPTALINTSTRIVAISHASNIVGEIRDVASVCDTVRDKSDGMAHVIVDGVAAAPHVYADLSKSNADFYAVSCHKLFGPHLGGLCAQRAALESLGDVNDADSLYRSWELGTTNYEACAGVGYGLARYFSFISNAGDAESRQIPRGSKSPGQSSFEQSGEATRFDVSGVKLTPEMVVSAYRTIDRLENAACDYVLKWLRKSPKVVVIDLAGEGSTRIPIISFFHRCIDSDHIARVCLDKGIVCRSDTFLAGPLLKKEIEGLGCADERVVRFSFVHYNTLEEAKFIRRTLESMDGW